MNILDAFPRLPDGLTIDDINRNAAEADAAVDSMDAEAALRVIDSETTSDTQRDALAIVINILLRQAYALGRRDEVGEAMHATSRYLRAWQGWASSLLDECGRQPLYGQHGDDRARSNIDYLVSFAPGVPRCCRCGCFLSRHKLEGGELRGCVDCECSGYLR